MDKQALNHNSKFLRFVHTGQMSRNQTVNNGIFCYICFTAKKA